MSIKYKSYVVFSLFLSVLLNHSLAGQYSGGTGTKQDPYQISKKQDLLELSGNVDDYNKHFVLTGNIDLSDEVYEKAIIAPDKQTSGEEYDGDGFTGSFDGNGHVISGLKIKSLNNDFLGLFGGIGKNGIVYDLSVESAEIVGGISGCHGIICGGVIFGTIRNCRTAGSVLASDNSTGVGGLCGANEHGTIENCHSSASVIAGNNYIGIGGLCGGNFEGIIRDSSSSGNVKLRTGCTQIGGLCGVNEDGVIERCFSSGSMEAGRQTKYIGGFVGGMMKGSIKNCYSTGSAQAKGESICLGGFCGAIMDGKIQHCYSTGRIGVTDPYRYLGGFCGGNKSGILAGNYWDKDSSQLSTSSGGKGLSSTQFKDKTEFEGAGWDIVDGTKSNKSAEWYILDNYPVLKWQLKNKTGKELKDVE